MSQGQEINRFYVPKAIICLIIYLTLNLFMYTHSLRLVKYITAKTQLTDSFSAGSIGLIDSTDLICMLIFSVYGCMAISYTVQAYTLANE
jgi:hypothetical protein